MHKPRKAYQGREGCRQEHVANDSEAIGLGQLQGGLECSDEDYAEEPKQVVHEGNVDLTLMLHTYENKHVRSISTAPPL